MDSSTVNDALLFQRVRKGDQRALQTLVALHHRPLFDFIYRLTDDRALADDLAQQTFIRLLTHGGDAPNNLRAWLFTIARNLATDHFRLARVQREQMTDFSDDGEPLISEADLSPEHLTILADQRQAIAALLQMLPPEQREVVILRFYHDLALNEIADVVNAPLGTVKSRLFHALKKLKYHFVGVESIDE